MKQYAYVAFTMILFGITVLVLNKNGYIPAPKPLTAQSSTEIDEPKRTDTGLGINDIKIPGKILYIKDNNLSLLDINSGETNPLVSGTTVEYPGVLSDGRVYFWQKDATVYSRLFIQKGKIFEKFVLPLDKNDGSLGGGTPPILASNGKFVVFTSDREAKDNYKRRALYQYNLETSELTRLTDNTLMNIYTAFINNDTSFIGFTYQNIEANKGSEPIALGLIEVGGGTVNLFPKVIVNNLAIAFAPDNHRILFTGQEGVSLFDVTKGKVTETLKTGTFQAISPEGHIAVIGEGTSTLKNDGKECPDQMENRKSAMPLSEVLVYQIKDENFIQVNSLVSSDFTVRLPAVVASNIFSPDGNKLLVEFQDKDHCEGMKGILDLVSKKVTPLPEVGRNTALWVNGM